MPRQNKRNVLWVKKWGLKFMKHKERKKEQLEVREVSTPWHRSNTLSRQGTTLRKSQVGKWEASTKMTWKQSYSGWKWPSLVPPQCSVIGQELFGVLLGVVEGLQWTGSYFLKGKFRMHLCDYSKLAPMITSSKYRPIGKPCQIPVQTKPYYICISRTFHNVHNSASIFQSVIKCQ